MARKRRVKVHLNKGDVRSLSRDEIKAILRAADDLIAVGGRALLAKILKGSKDKKVLELKLNENPKYGYYQHLTIDQIQHRIDWMILSDYLEIEYSGRLPVIVFSEKGWEIERDQYADELLAEWQQWVNQNVKPLSMEYLKDRNRGMMLLFLEKVKETKNQAFIPFLKQWEKIEYKKMKQAIRDVIQELDE
ncbi:RQC-minor-1 family DNA-binding protein [Bacillus sp. FJAT-47783]|uniref:RQC-minor-1 family DNA-binding protein n=1 Tax=Bacillus sp. FJAT-47783 TaxID=2922712 RepID=UPI001FAD1E73|nr:RQC-minor-1 family DNA-binding protein [Bacillus sp. FJAT-47783]